MKQFQLFADLLSYPRPGLAAAARECEALVAPDNPEAAVLLHGFAGFAAETPPGQLEELYTAAFDLDASSSLYVGYHLLGESYKRSVFMLELKRCYEAQSLDIGTELADHLAVVLRFLAGCDDAELAQELVTEALVPALEKRLGRRGGSEGEERDEGDEIPEQPHPCFLAGCDDAEPAQGLVTLEKRLVRQGGSEGEEGSEGDEIPEQPHPYLDVLRALQSVLQQQPQTVGIASEGGGSHG